MEQFIIQCKRKKKEAVWFESIMAGVYLFGLIMAMLVCTFAGEKTSVAFGTIFAVAMAFFMHLFGNMFTFLQEFNLAVSMGQVRKSFVWAYEAAAFVELLAMTVTAWLMYLLEKALYRLFLPEVTMEIDVGAVFLLKSILPILFAMMLTELFVAALMLRFGRKCLWGIWAVWMFICLLPNQMVRNERLHAWAQKILALVVQQANLWGKPFFISTGILFGALLVGISWNMLRKQRVTV